MIGKIRKKRRRRRRFRFTLYGKCSFQCAITGYLEYHVTEDQDGDIDPKIAIGHRQFRQYFGGRAVVAIDDRAEQFLPIVVVHGENEGVQGILDIAYVTDVVHEAWHVVKKDHESGEGKHAAR